MIEKAELRVGNIVNVNYSYTEEDIKPCVLTADLLGDLLIGDNFNINVVDCYPIPLTPEILEQCGFTRERRMFYKGIFFVGLDEIGHNCGFGVKNTTGIISTLKYLHQLQNLYFALTGEELQIKQSATA